MAGGGGHSCVMEKGWKGQDRKVGSGDEMIPWRRVRGS